MNGLKNTQNHIDMEVKKNDRVVYVSKMYDVEKVIVTLVDDNGKKIEVEQSKIDMIYSRQYQSKMNKK